MKTILLLGVVALIVLFLSWRNPEHMTLVRGVPVVEPQDVQALLPLWKPDPAALQKEKDDMATVNKAVQCASARGDQQAARTMWNGGLEQSVPRATAYNTSNNCS